MFGEPFGHGWGLDLPGYGETLKFTNVQAHTLKPASVPNCDGHMKYEDNLIKFTQDGAGRCLTARSGDPNSALDAAPCSQKNKTFLQSWSIQVLVS